MKVRVQGHPGVSLGNVDTLVTHPASTPTTSCPEERRKMGIGDG